MSIRTKILLLITALSLTLIVGSVAVAVWANGVIGRITIAVSVTEASTTVIDAAAHWELERDALTVQALRGADPNSERAQFGLLAADLADDRFEQARLAMEQHIETWGPEAGLSPTRLDTLVRMQRTLARERARLMSQLEPSMPVQSPVFQSWRQALEDLIVQTREEARLSEFSLIGTTAETTLSQKILLRMALWRWAGLIGDLRFQTALVLLPESGALAPDQEQITHLRGRIDGLGHLVRELAFLQQDTLGRDFAQRFLAIEAGFFETWRRAGSPADLTLAVRDPVDQWLDDSGVMLDEIYLLGIELSRSLHGQLDAEIEHIQVYLVGASGLVVLTVLVFIGVISFVRREITSPLRRIIENQRRLALGHLDVDIGGTDRRDELGQLARALLVFKRALIKQRRSDKLDSTLLELSGRMRGARTASDLCAAILSQMGRDLEVVSSAIYIVDTDAQMLRVVASYNWPPGRPKTVPIGDGLLGEALRQDRYLVIDGLPSGYAAGDAAPPGVDTAPAPSGPDAAPDSGAAPPLPRIALGTGTAVPRTIIAVPLTGREGHLGIMELLTLAPPQPFHEAYLEATAAPIAAELETLLTLELHRDAA